METIMPVRQKDRKRNKKTNIFANWKFPIVTLSIFALSLAGFVSYYHLDWALLADVSFYENLANPSIRVVRVAEGLRKEEIADIMGDKLGWNELEKIQFENANIAFDTTDMEGHYFPKTYMLQKDATPTTVSTTMFSEFSKQTATVKKSKSSMVINQDTIIKVASIIQREAAGKQDMKLISGIIWNRVFSGMKLQIDATLQYAKGSEEDGWWEQVSPKDKKIDSPYNTYTHADLPPTPIANPGLSAIDAAYNPQKTSCMFYLHDSKGRIHCSVTYAEHLKNISRYY